MKVEVEVMERMRHSSAHVLAQAVRRLWKDAKISIGPVIENGYYYDFDLEHRLSVEDFGAIEAEMKAIKKSAQAIEREEVTREAAAEIFANEPYKLELLEAIPEGEPITVYRQGEFVDLCRGPHVENTSQIGEFKLLSVAGAYFRGDEKRPMLQRIYGTSFKTKAELKDYLRRVEEAARNDHRKLGQQMELFMLNENAPGMPFFLPKGLVLWNELMKYWREVHKRYGYDEIKTPTMMRRKLWETSGHWEHYAAGMYTLKVDEDDYAIKPMNCPGGVLVWKASHNRLPLKRYMKLAEVGQVHRCEASGTLHGLFRVREFTQDDAHIFCTPEQIEPAINETISLIDEVYRTFGLEYEMELSTRPENSIGSDEVWAAAEGALKTVLGERPYTLNEGDGAFYGPKIDFHIHDRMGRTWQCATIQLDFNLPQRFGLEYLASDGSYKQPVMIHRVVLGSIERFIGIMTEHFGGAYPLWLAPEQARILPLTDSYADEADSLRKQLEGAGLRVTVDARSETLNKRIKTAALQKVPYTLVIGEREKAEGTVNVRVFGQQRSYSIERAEFIKSASAKVAEKSLTY